MIKANEIRIGNYVRHGAKWSSRQVGSSYVEFDFQWTEQDWYWLGESTMFIEDISPVPITEELLIQLGYNWVEEADGWADKNHIIYGVKYDCWEIHPFCTNDKSFYKIIRNIHELQNLHYALTGEELK